MGAVRLRLATCSYVVFSSRSTQLQLRTQLQRQSRAYTQHTLCSQHTQQRQIKTKLFEFQNSVGVQGKNFAKQFCYFES